MRDFDHEIGSMEDAIRIGCEIVNEIVDPAEIRSFIRQGVAGPTIVEAMKVADSSKRLREYGDTLIAQTEGRELQDLVASGEFSLVLLCGEMHVTSKNDERDPAFNYIETADEKRWWEFWK